MSLSLPAYIHPLPVQDFCSHRNSHIIMGNLESENPPIVCTRYPVLVWRRWSTRVFQGKWVKFPSVTLRELKWEDDLCHFPGLDVKWDNTLLHSSCRLMCGREQCPKSWHVARMRHGKGTTVPVFSPQVPPQCKNSQWKITSICISWAWRILLLFVSYWEAGERGNFLVLGFCLFT